MSNCPVPANLPDSDQAAGLATALQALGIQACQTTSVAGGGFSIFPPVAVAFGGTSSVGCEQVSAISNSISAAQNQVTCILNTTQASATALIDQNNTINITAVGLTYNLNFQQINTSNASIATSLSQQQSVNISTALSTSMSSLLTTLQNSTTGYLASPQGQKAVTMLKENLSQDTINNIANMAVSTTAINIVQNNAINITLTGNDYFSATNAPNSTITLSQQNLASYQANMIVSAFYTQIFKTDAGAAFKTQIQNNLTSTAQGVDLGAIFSPIVIVMVVIALAVLGFVFFGGTTINSVMKYIIPLAIVGAIAVAVIFGIEKNVLVASISSGAAVLLGIFEFVSVRKSAQ